LPITNLEEQEAEAVVEESATTHQEIPEGEPVRTVRMTGIQLVNTTSGYQLAIPIEGGVIGRSGNIHTEHFQHNLFVSNQHAQFKMTGTRYTLTDLNSINGTKVNGQQLLAGQEIPIKARDHIIFANLEYMEGFVIEKILYSAD
jgi:hypothetical protein